jgi:hypothetical protein
MLSFRPRCHVPLAEERKPNTTPFIGAFKRRMPGVVDLPVEEAPADAGSASGDSSVEDVSGKAAGTCAADEESAECGDTAQTAAEPTHMQLVQRRVLPPSDADDEAEKHTARTPAVTHHSKPVLALAAAADAGWHMSKVTPSTTGYYRRRACRPRI